MPNESTLVDALVAAQLELKNPPLNGFNPHFKSKFATLLDVRDAIVPVMNRHGIAVVQAFAVSPEGTHLLNTFLIKNKDDIITSSAVIPPPANIQAWAASVTYIRRVSLLAIAGVVGDPDADAEDVVRPPAELAALKAQYDMREAKEKIRNAFVGSPHPDTGDIVPTATDKYVDAFLTHLNVGDAGGVYRVHMDLQAEGQELYSAVWQQIGSKERAAIKVMIAMQKPKAATF